MNEENIAEVTVDPVPPEAEATCRDAAESCPVDAISVEAAAVRYFEPDRLG